MTLHVHRTEADFREASAAVRGLRLTSIGTLPMFLLFVAFSLGTMIGGIVQERPPGEPPRGPLEVMMSSFSLLVVGVYWGVVALRTAGKRAHGFVRPPPPLTNMGVVFPTLLWVFLFAVSLVATAYVPASPPTPPQPPMPLGRLLRTVFLPFVPVVTFVAAAIWMFLRLHGRNITRSFELQLQMHRPGTIQVSQEWVIVTDDAQQTCYRWQAFVGWQETANLFLLYNSFVTFEMVPKRAFPSPEAIQHFTALVRQYIGEGNVGFQVLPPRPVPPPLPATVQGGRANVEPPA
jgi:hypothetical protein